MTNRHLHWIDRLALAVLPVGLLLLAAWWWLDERRERLSRAHVLISALAALLWALGLQLALQLSGLWLLVLFVAGLAMLAVQLVLWSSSAPDPYPGWSEPDTQENQGDTANP